MKHIWEKDFLPFLKEIVYDLRIIEKNEELEYIYSTLQYITEVGEISNQKEFIQIIKTGLSEKIEEKTMTLAQLFRQEGLKEGLEQGLEQGIAKGHLKIKVIAKRLLAQGLPVDQVIMLTELSLEEIKEL